MLALGRALMSGPRLLLLDEPSLGLAPVVVDTLFDALQEIHASGVSILLVEQNVTRALAISQRGYLLSDGEIVLLGDADAMLADPRCSASASASDPPGCPPHTTAPGRACMQHRRTSA